MVKQDRSIHVYTKVLEINPRDSVAYNNRGYVFNNKGEYGHAAQDWKKALGLDPSLADAYNSLGWLYATCPRSQYRNSTEAVSFATKACEMTKWKNWGYLDTLAAAYAQKGDFRNAVSYQQKAITVLGSGEDAATIQDLKSRLTLYRAGRPYRENQ